MAHQRLDASAASGGAGEPDEPQAADAGDVGEAEERHRQRCAAKLPYMSRAEAKLDAKRIQNHGRGKRHPYECPLCGYWHLTSLDRRESRRARKVVLGG